MNTPKDGGPAMPTARGPYDTGVSGGITVRDYFAAAALQGMLASDETFSSISVIAKFAYTYADAMLAARKEGAT